MWTFITIAAHAVTIVLLLWTMRSRKKADEAQFRINKATAETIVQQTEMIVEQEKKIVALTLQIGGITSLYVRQNLRNNPPQAEASQVDTQVN